MNASILRLIDRHPWLMLLLLSIVWGSSYILIKRGLVSFSPLQLGSLRVTISALCFLPFIFKQWRLVPKREIPLFIAAGLCGSAIPAVLFGLAQTQISSSLASILNALTPILTLIIGILFFQQRFIRSKGLGISIGLLGALVLLILGQKGQVGGHYIYGFLVVIAAACYATSSNLVATYLAHHRPFTISAVSFSLVGLPCFLLLFSTDFFTVMKQDPNAWASLGYISILAVLGTVIASILFYWLIQRTSAVYGSTIAYLIPIIGIIWGIWDGEIITIWQLLGLFLVLIGVYFTGRKRLRIEN